MCDYVFKMILKKYYKGHFHLSVLLSTQAMHPVKYSSVYLYNHYTLQESRYNVIEVCGFCKLTQHVIRNCSLCAKTWSTFLQLADGPVSYGHKKRPCLGVTSAMLNINFSTKSLIT